MKKLNPRSPPEPEPSWWEPLFTAVKGFRECFRSRPARVRYLYGEGGQIVGVQCMDVHEGQVYTARVAALRGNRATEGIH